ncbi:MAG: hypothetical protein P8184_06690 [Calditrichia bacterium]
MGRITNNQQGSTLFELIVVMILVGVALPSILGLMGMIGVYTARYSVMETAVGLAESRMEEICGRKAADPNWYTDPSQFEEDVNLADGYRRTVAVTSLSGWGSESLDTWEVTVTVSHRVLPNGYSLAVRFTRY